uniref:DUF4005 domain-containing protein n=1 Tax=Brassica oleracea var. oleracea TaxID=109376 RepID=A0A0D3E7L6_BRAOL
MGKTPSPGKWIKSLLGKKSSKSSLDKGTDKLRSAKKEEPVVKVKDNSNVSTLPTNPSPVLSSQEVAATQTVLVPDVVVLENQPKRNGTNANPESGDDTEELKLEEDATKDREEFQMLKGVIKLQAVIRGHLVRRQAVATYSCIWGIVKLQALVRGKIARSSVTGVHLQKTNPQTLQGSTYSWLEGSTKLSMIDKLLVSSPMVSPLKIHYGPEDSNSAKVWLERWTQLQVWSPGPLVIRSLVPKSQTKKPSFQAVEADKGKLKRGIKKPPGGLNTGNGSSSSRSTAEKRSVRKASTLGKEVSNDKPKQSSRKSTSAIKEGSSSLEVKDEKPRISLKKANGIEVKPTRKSAEKKKEVVDSVQKEVPGDKVSSSVVDTPEEEEEVKDSSETVSKEVDLDKDEKSLVLDTPEQGELKTEEKNDKAEEEIQEPDVQISSENGNAASEFTKQSDRRASLPAKIENQQQDDGVTHSGRKIPSYMAPTASAKARVRGGQGSPRFGGQEKHEKNGITRRHSLPPGANGKLSAMSPRAHRLLIASAKGSMNSDRSFSSSKDIGGFTRGFSTAPQHANRNLRAPELINQQAFQFSTSHKGSGREKKIETDARNHLQNRGYKTQNQSWQERGSQRRSYQARERSKFDSDRYSRPSREHHSQRSLPGPPSKSYYREVQKIAHDPRDTGFSASKSIHANVERGSPQHASQGMIPQSVLNEARGEARDVLLQYTKCADPTEMEVREERVRQAEERGQIEANARKIARASLNSSEEQWMSPAKSSSERVPASQRLGPNEQAKEPNVGLVVSEGADNSRRRTPISQWLGDVATSPIKSPRVPAVLRLGTGHSGSPSKLPEDKIPLKRKPGRPPGRVGLKRKKESRWAKPQGRRIQGNIPIRLTTYLYAT